MGLFSRKRKAQSSTVIQPAIDNRVEIELHKEANDEAVKMANETNEHLKQLVQNNGFTLKIYLAANPKHGE